MDLLLKCTTVFRHLLQFRYCFVLGRKNIKKEIILGFDETDFHHLVGLHKLKDISIARANRQKVFRDILSGLITYQTIQKSSYAEECISRLSTFQYIEKFLDSDQLIFKYNSRNYPGSLIRSEYLLKFDLEIAERPSFLFIDQRDGDLYFCRTFFPLGKIDYSFHQMQYTLLRKEKIKLDTGIVEVQFDRLGIN